MKKVRKKIGRGEYTEARRQYYDKPNYTLQHLVRERFPSFQAALTDFDDALCMIHLYASLPAERRISPQSTSTCLKLTLGELFSYQLS